MQVSVADSAKIKSVRLNLRVEWIYFSGKIIRKPSENLKVIFSDKNIDYLSVEIHTQI